MIIFFIIFLKLLLEKNIRMDEYIEKMNDDSESINTNNDFFYDPKSVIPNTLIYFITCDYCRGIIFEPIECISCGKKFCEKHLINDFKDCCSSPKFIKSKLLEEGLSKGKFRCQLDNEGNLLLSHNQLENHYIECKKLEEIKKENNINANNLDDDLQSEIKRLHNSTSSQEIDKKFLGEQQITLEELKKKNNNDTNINYTFKKYHKDPLYLKTDRNRNWKCNQCNLNYEKKSIYRFRCDKCDYDVCELCMIFYENINPIEFFKSKYDKNIGWEERKEIINKNLKNNC